MSRSSKIIHPSSDLDDDVLIKVDNVSKKFCRDFKKSLWYGLKDTAADILHPKHKSEDSKLRPGEFWANQNISFEVKRGECLGLIGHNGAGKTTLLKMLNGLIKPDIGNIEMHGRTGALIALGAGFNPILTGRENIYVNGSILGLHKKEIDAKLQEIVDFAEIEDAIDAPVRTYSSGMQVRLGFAVAVILIQPDVLILDEVLAVGDINFTIKCLNVVRHLSERSAVIFVSHNIQLISQFCSSVLLLDTGCIKMSTDIVSKGIAAYLSAIKQTVETAGTGEVTCEDEVLWTDRGDLNEPRLVSRGDSLGISLTMKISQTVPAAEIRIALADNADRPVAAFSIIDSSKSKLQLSAGNHSCRFDIGDLGLTPGKYHFVIAVWAQEPKRICLRKSGVLAFNIPDTGSEGHISAPLSLFAQAEVQSL